MTSLGTLELQLTANQAALYQQLNQTRAYATQVAKDIEKQINQAFSGAGGQNIAGLNQSTAQAASAGQAAGKTFADRFKNAVEPIKSILSNVFNGVFVGAGIGAFNSITGVVGSALGAVQQFAGEIFNVTKDFQGFESSLKTFLKGNQKEIDDFVGKLEKFAATTPFELKNLQQAAIQNLATGAKPDQLIKDLKTIGDVAAGANAQLGDLMEVYAKSRTEGKLMNEDIDQFTGRGVQLLGELAKMLGAKESEIRQLATDGKLEFRHLEEALRRMSAEGGVYFGAMENKAKTLEGRLSNVQDTFYQFQKSIGQAFEPIMNYLIQTFGDIISSLTSSKGVLEEVKKEAEKLVEYFKANPELIQALNKAIQELVSGVMKGLLALIKSTAEYLKDNPTAIKDATNQAGKLFNKFGDLLNILGKIGGAALNFLNTIKEAFGFLNKSIDKLDSLTKGIPGLENSELGNFLKYGPLGTSAVQGLLKKVGINLPGFPPTTQPQAQPQASSPNSGNGNVVGNIVQGLQGFFGLGSPPPLDTKAIAKKYKLQSLLIQELQSGRILGSVDSDKSPDSPASTIKLIVGDLIKDQVEQKLLSLKQEITLKPGEIAEGSSLKSGQKIKVSELLIQMLRDSDNTSTNALINLLGGTKKSTELANKKGYSDTVIGGLLSIPGSVGFRNKSTANDTTKAMRTLLLDNSEAGELASSALRGTRNFKYEGEAGGKIGNNSKVIGNIGIVNINGKEYIVSSYANVNGNIDSNREIIKKATNEIVERLKSPVQLSSSTINQPKYKIVESVGSRNENVTQYSDLEPHHPSIVKRGGHKNRPYGIVEGRKEELNPLNRNLIKKDFVLIDPQGKQYGVPVPSPVTGYAGQVGQGWGAVNLYADKEMTKLIAQVGHMINLQVKNGQLVQYGQTLGGQAGMGKKGVNTYGTHVDMSADPETYRRYIRDLQAGVFKGTGQNLFQQGVDAAKQFFTLTQNALPTGAGLSSSVAKIVRGKNEGIFAKAGLTNSLVDLVKQSEGFETTPYPDRTQYSVGFGTKAKSTSESLTVEEANQRLLEELLYKRSRVQKMVKVPINNNQLDALTSFAFNVGEGNFGESTLLKKLNSGDYEGAAKEFLRWNKGEVKGVKQVLPGLTRRRNSEMRLFLGQEQSASSQPSVSQQTANSNQQIPGAPTGGNRQDQRNVKKVRDDLAKSEYDKIKDEIEAANKEADNRQKQDRQNEARRRKLLNDKKQAEFAANEALAPDVAKKTIQEQAKLHEINNRYNEKLISLNQELEDRIGDRELKLKILSEAKKRNVTVSPSDAGVDYSKSINQLNKEIEETKKLRDMELATYDLNKFNADKEIERNKERQREIGKLSRAHEDYINQLKLVQSLSDDATKQNVQSKIDKAGIEHQADMKLMSLRHELYDLQDKKVYLLGQGGLNADSDQVKKLQKEIDNLVATINSIGDSKSIDLKIFENQSNQIEKQNQRLRESEKQEIEHSKQVLEINKQIFTAQTQQQKAKLQFQLEIINAIQQEKQALTPLKQQYDDLVQVRELLIKEGKFDAASDAIKALDDKIADLNERIKMVGDQSKLSFEILAKAGQKTIEQGGFADLESALSKEASMLPAQTGLIRRRGGNEYEVSALEAEAARMEEQLRYKQELLQIDQQIAAAKGKANEYTEQEIAALKANAEAINKINLEGISQQVRTLGKDLLDVGKNAFGSFFNDIIFGSKSAGDAFKDLVNNIAQQLTQLAVNSLISSIVGRGGGFFSSLFGGIGGSKAVAKFHGGIIPNYANGGSVGAVADALHRERSMSGGKTPVLAALTPGEMVLTIKQAKRFQELRLDKVLNFANGGVVGDGQNLGNEIGSKNMTINIPVTVEGGGDSSVNVPQLQNSLRSVVLAEIQKQQRPGGALNR